MQNNIFKKILTIACLWALSAGSVYAQQPVVPQMQCVRVLPNGNVQLSWSPGALVGLLCQGTGQAFSGYTISVSSNASGVPATVVASLPNATDTTYTDLSADASVSTLYYFVTTNCGGIVSLPSAIYDTQLPPPPVVSVATVLNDNITQVSWQASPSIETTQYIIYRSDANGNFIPIDTIAATNSEYIDLNANAANEPQSYKVAAVDGCGTTGVDNGIPHQTIHLTADGNACAQSISLDWTAYQGWGVSGVDRYEIGVAFPSNPNNYVSVDTLPANLTVYNYSLPQGEASACFRIKATRTDGVTSLSNTVCVTVNASQGPQYMYMTNATVTAPNEVTATWLIDLDNDLRKLYIRRGVNDSTDIVALEPYDLPSPLATTMQYVDNSGVTSRDTYVYQVQHTDSCDVKTYSTIAKTMRLLGRDDFNLTNRLEWTAFYITYGTVQNYTLYRQDANGVFQPITVLNPADTLLYSDPVSEFANTGNNEFCYVVEATFDLVLPNGTTQTNVSRSNEVCITQSPRIYMPNAFLPNGVNNVFKPIFLNEQSQTYSFLILNRWGEIVFSTNNTADGWDGYVRGKLAEQGTYAYEVQMKTTEGFLIKRNGTVTLIR